MFNDRYGLTQAVLDGTKTMTRRVIPELLNVEDNDISDWGLTDGGKAMITLYEGGRPTTDIFPAYQPGEVVAVAQSYKSVFEESLNYALPRYHWLDDHIDDKGFGNKLFVKASEMPHQIQITDVKIERLQYISEEDCLREGIQEYFPYIDRDPNDKVRTFQYFKDGKIRHRISPASKCFAYLIDDISGKGTWESNPYVFAYSFKLIK